MQRIVGCALRNVLHDLRILHVRRSVRGSIRFRDGIAGWMSGSDMKPPCNSGRSPKFLSNSPHSIESRHIGIVNAKQRDLTVPYMIRLNNREGVFIQPLLHHQSRTAVSKGRGGVDVEKACKTHLRKHLIGESCAVATRTAASTAACGGWETSATSSDTSMRYGWSN